MNRRKFVSQSSLALGSLMMLQCKTSKMATRRFQDVGLQLWSVRDEMARNPIGTLKVLSGIGYTDVECAGYADGKFYGMSPAEFKSVLNDHGLKMKSGHTRTGNQDPKMTHTMTNRWEAVCEDAASMGQQSIICGYFFDGERVTIDDYKKHAALFNTCGEKAKEYGLAFGHHNHDFEFVAIDGQVPYDILLDETDADLVKFELDLYWIRKGNADYKTYFEKHAGRFPWWHIKDMDDTEEKFFTEVGNGVIDWEDVFSYADVAGMEYFYVEQDAHRTYKPLKSVEVSFDYLAKIG